ncbi:MAG: endonuclease Q family protein [Kiritimatiellia bacterium]
MFYADLHVHSRYSRATSPDGTLDSFARWAQLKGLGVVGTGDFTHPAWRQAIGDQLIPAEPGLFRLKPDRERELAAALPEACREGVTPFSGATRFLLQVEISTIYKRDGATRKVHHLILVPGLKEADALTARLARMGNLKSDGRPILGLDSRNLMEMVLESGEGCMLIPAHIWTPWFSALGSKSGFDTIADCYADLAPHVFAAETGLSSDPPMNWRVSSLDRYRLISNSDCHSPDKLGREATAFDTAVDYFAMRRALETGAGYGGTVEFFPEMGKYHLDGHRNCGVCWEPGETEGHRGLCSVCGKPVTVGVLARVAELADRPGGVHAPASGGAFRRFIPLAEVLGEMLDCGAATGKVEKAWNALETAVGPELYLLGHAPLEAIEKAGPAPLAEAIRRMRESRVICEAGFDGQYGIVRLFKPEELGRKAKPRKILPPKPPKAETPRQAAARVKKEGGKSQLNLF